MSESEIIVGIGRAASDGTTSVGNALVLSLACQGIAACSYNSYQSVIRGGHSWLQMRFSSDKPLNHGDQGGRSRIKKWYGTNGRGPGPAA